MTDERKAMFEDWKNKNKDKIEGVVTTLLSYEKGVDTKTCYDEVDWIIKKAFLAGLKAGRPKWHKVADRDLPNNTDNVLSDKGTIVYYNFTHACWVDERASVEIDDVIEWCELPKYMEN